MPGRLLPYGDRAVLIEVDDLAEALRLHELLAEPEDRGPGGRVPGLVDVVVGARTVLLVAGSQAELAAVHDSAKQALADLSSRPGPARTRGGAGERVEGGPVDELPADRVIEVPVHYDGEDLHEVAELTGLSTAEVIRAHSGRLWRVGFAGFAPGFAYLVDGDPRLRVPRRTTPRARVPAGAVGLADEFSGVYPRPSPGGWQLIGRTDAPLWDLHRDPPALLRPGHWVRFTEADPDPDPAR